ncbi:cysteine and histidine-rich domain-containing protein 1-like isoform X2 [Zootoca vivipara]|uniref:cysteine and histidine-rich domain-containing protein 1-like isoform X2 n=1 Tax=Zootoca vivipara TaxID=8524 RepID=UPI00293BDE65|nr:cysteine and histidine-rich domain-containing protein 1-like isoform X2 [Zootoca vivipara]
MPNLLTLRVIGSCLILSQAIGPSSSILSTRTGSGSPGFTDLFQPYLETPRMESGNFCMQSTELWAPSYLKGLEQGCTKGYHSNEKPPEPEEALSEPKVKTSTEVVIQSAEMMRRERPSSDEPKQLLPVKVSGSLAQALSKLDLSPKDQPPVHGSADTSSLEVSAATTCKNSGCKAVYQGEESNRETCTFHPGVPVFHEGMKYWSCCGMKTTDFTAFLEQKGCSRGKHTWVKKQDKKLVSCWHDWHQTGSQVVVTIYAKTPRPNLSSVKANRTTLDIHITFEGDKVFQAKLDLWGVINVEKSFLNMLPSKVEITLKKENAVTWARLEHPQSKPQTLQQQLETDSSESQEARGANPEEESDDSLSWSEEEEGEERVEGERSQALPASHVSDGK